MSTMELSSGSYFDFENMSASEFTLGDVAQGLANSCRFSGQCSRFYSVAEHAVLVSQRLADEGESLLVQLEGLHHDDSEAFLTDIPKPAKDLLPDYQKLEAKVMTAILEGLGLGHLEYHKPVIKQADRWALMQEAGELLPSKGEGWTDRAAYGNWDGTQRGLGLQPMEAELVWLARHEHIIKQAMRKLA